MKQSKETELVPQAITCSCVGEFLQPAGQAWADKVVSSKLLNGMLLLYFKNGFTCSNVTCKIPKENK